MLGLEKCKFINHVIFQKNKTIAIRKIVLLIYNVPSP